MRSRWQRLILAVVSGLLGLAAFPSVSLGWLAWIALAPLLIAVSRSRTSRESFVLGVVAGLIQWAGLLAWIPRVLMLYGGVPAYLAWMLELLLAAVLALYPAVACAATRLCLDAGGRRLLLVFPFVWVALEWLRTHILLGGFPWLLLGYSQTEWFTLVQIADLTGVFGVSFLVAGVNAAAAWSWIHRSRGVRSLGPAAAAVLMVAVALAYGQVMRARWSGTETPYRAAMLQGNLGFEDPYPALAWKFQEGYARMLETLGAQPIDLLLLPEAPAARSFQDDAEHRNAMARLASRAARGMVLNNVHRDGAGRAAAYYNSAYVLSPSGTEVGRYDKIHLVPFGEYVPWRDLFSFAEPITKDVGAFSAGSEFRTFDLQDGPVSVMICFEAVFPYISREFVRRGSRLLINLTNDGWYGDSAAPYQHLQMARWRAIENRRFLLRATNSGISAIIDPTGRIQASSGLLRTEVCLGRFGYVRARTFYSLHGDVFALLCAMITAACLAAAAGRAWRLRHRSSI